MTTEQPDTHDDGSLRDALARIAAIAAGAVQDGPAATGPTSARTSCSSPPTARR